MTTAVQIRCNAGEANGSESEAPEDGLLLHRHSRHAPHGLGELARNPAQRDRVLLVEDDALIREHLAEILALEGYEVVTAVDGLDALAQLQSEPTPDLVITDLQMPRANGWVLALELQREPRLASLPLVVISGVHDSGSAGGFLGAAATFQKPFDVSRFVETLNRLLEARRQETQPESKED